ncbi:PPE domain-containing protein [Mycolicibacterium conceptionense]|uniref:PPE domain-containing protein n=1 Tax=Mycolicibacterium conceptionense TaxID=451644 RepID=UPI000AFA805C|nr:hypothetical protein [Mycolicibacterium conceptionense]
MAEGVVGWSSDEMKQAAARITANPAAASPVSDPGLPDSLEITAAAINQLKASSSRLELTFAAADTEAGRMASALRAAADAFDEVVSKSKEEFDKQMHSDGARPSKRFETVVPSAVMDAAPATVDVSYPASAETGAFANWRESAKKIHNGDGTSELKNFMDEWATSKTWIEKTHLKDFEAPDGDGTAAEAYTEAMKRLRGWWNDMGPECGRMVEQAQNLIDAHRDLVSEHPTLDDVATYEKMDPGGLVNIIIGLSPVASVGQAMGKGALNKYFQERSEAALKKYADRVAFKEIRPGMPPSIRGVPSTNPGGQPPGVNPPGTNPPGTNPSTGGATPGMPEIPSVDTPSMSPASADPSAGQGSGGAPSGGAPSGGAPSGGAPSGGMPSGGLPKGAEGMPEVPGLGEPSLKPASAGGGGGGMGGGGGGMPAGPLGPAVGADSVGASPAAARGGGVPAGAPGSAGAGGMGGGMGGMGGGHGQGQGKEKRRNPNLAEDEDLYVEDRAYTEAVIGRRARKDVKDGK